MIFLKIVLILTFLLIFYQDSKERLVWWFLFPLISIACGTLYVLETSIELFLFSILFNGIFIIILLLILFLYSKFKIKIHIKEAIGLGDVLLFFALTCTFSLVSFITLFVFSLILSLLIHIVLSKRKVEKTVPLAGYMSLFFAISYIAYWSGLITNLYSL